MNFIVSSLSEIIDKFGKKRTQVLLESFVCHRNQDEVNFLIKKAIMMEKKDLCRTYLLTDGKVILGFFTLCMKSTTITPDVRLTKSFLSMIGMNPKNNDVQCFLLAHVCRSSLSEKGFGLNLFNEAYLVLTEAKKMIGGRVIRLDCKDELVDYYSKLGFIFIQKNADGDLNQMLIVL